MTKQRTADAPAKKFNVWMIFAFVPFLNWIAFLYMGETAKAKKWTRAGYLYAVIGLFFSILFWFFVLMSYGTAHEHEGAVRQFASWVYNNGQFAVLICLMNVIPIVHFLFALPEYWKRLAAIAARRAPEPAAPALLHDKKWMCCSRLFCLWLLVPPLSGFALLHMRVRGDEADGGKAYPIAGIAFGAIGVLTLNIVARLFNGSGLYRITVWELALKITIGVLIAAMWLYNGFRVLRDMPAYLTRRAAVIEQRRREYPCLNDRAWLVRCNWWVVFLASHYSAPAALIFTGITAKKRKRAIVGVLCMVILILAVILLNEVLFEIQTSYGTAIYRMQNAIRESRLDLILTIIVLIAGALFVGYDSYILARAQLAGGYVDDFEAERAEEAAERWNQHAAKHSVSAASDADETPVAESVPPAESGAAAARTPARVPPAAQTEHAAPLLDVNTCSEEAYLALPGVTVTDAKRAMRFRAQHGGFESTDAFVMELGLKPHFAARIFPMITASPLTPPDRPSGQDARHRVIDY